ncbi:MAG TPA: DUF1828 domain-containing protein [Opitutaceae bacterium]|nr:DUF1828 domain-containing protein [Opitutaceae bacterium]
MSICQRITSELGGLFQCENVNGYTRIRTPFLYPDGDIIDLFYSEEGGQPTLSDMGETLRWLRAQTISQKKSPKQNKLIEDVCINHGMELYKGMLITRFKMGETAAAAVMRAAQGALRVADVWFTIRTRSVETITDEVADFLKGKDISFDQSVQISGRSSKTWRIDFQTRTPRRSTFIYVLSTGSRAAATSIVEHTVTAWHDLSAIKATSQGLEFISLFDDTLDIWSDRDFRLVDELSYVGRWSRPDEFAQLLTG